MRYIESWLTGLGLEYIIPKLKENSVTTPKQLAKLTLRDMYEFGVEDSEDRKKLYFLIQRLQAILSSKSEAAGGTAEEGEESSGVAGSTSGSGSKGEENEEDLAVLRRRRRSSSATAANNPTTTIEKTDKTNSTKSSPKPTENNTIKSVAALQDGAPSRTVERPRLQRSKTTSSLSRGSNKSSASVPATASAMSDITSRVENTSKGAPQSTASAKSSVNSSAASLHNPPPLAAVAAPALVSAAGSKADLLLLGKQRVDAPAPALFSSTSRPESQQMQWPQRPQSSINQTQCQQSQDGGGRRSAWDRNNENEAILSSAPKYSPVRVPVAIIPTAAAAAEGGVVEDMAIRVVVRKRPLSRAEEGRGERDVLDVGRGGLVLVHEPKTKVDLTKIVDTQAFYFDDAFHDEETNIAIYHRTVGALVPFVFEGGKASCFAYGQTGSGKTFTMMGSSPGTPSPTDANAGLYILAARDVFTQLQKPRFTRLQVHVSCFEIYGGKLFDLLNDRAPVKCLEDARQQVQLPGLSEHCVDSVDQLLELMAAGHALRSTGATGANAESSRSHQVLQISIKEEVVPASASSNGLLGGRRRLSVVPQVTLVQRGKLSFIDLAGSERGADTTHASKQTRMEGAEINTSLLALKEVIRSLERKQGHTPFRGSKLTQVLKDSFVGEKTRTCMIACVSPSHNNCEHTLNTLRYADRVKEHQSQSQQGGGTNEGASAVYPIATNSNSSPAPETNRITTSRPSTAVSGVALSAAVMDKRPVTSSRMSVASTSPPRASIVSAASAVDRRPTTSSRMSVASTSPPRGSTRPAALSPSRSKALSPGRASANSSNSNGTAVSKPILKVVAGAASAVLPVSAGLRSPPRGVLTTPAAVAATAANVGVGPRVIPAAALLSSATATTAAVSSGPSSSRPATSGGGSQQKDVLAPASVSKKLSPKKPQQPTGLSASHTEAIRHTVELLSAHKSSIAEMVEVMKDEMELVQEMEGADDRDSENYVDQLEMILDLKETAIHALKRHLKGFQTFRGFNEL